jgi:hypothetical protein
MPLEGTKVDTTEDAVLRRSRPGIAARPSAPHGAYDAALLRQAFLQSLRKFDPRVQIHNPVMFVVWLGALVTLARHVDPSGAFAWVPAQAVHKGDLVRVERFSTAICWCTGSAASSPPFIGIKLIDLALSLVL